MTGEHIAGFLFIAGAAAFYGAFLMMCISVGYFGDELRKMQRQAGYFVLAAGALVLAATLISHT